MPLKAMENVTNLDVIEFISRYLKHSSNKDLIEIPTDSINSFLDHTKLITFMGLSEEIEHIVVSTNASQHDGHQVKLIRWPFYHVEFRIYPAQKLRVVGSVSAIVTVAKKIKLQQYQL